MPRLEFEAQSVQEMRARWKDAMKYAYVHETISSGGIRPGEIRANVFDFHGGLRVIASVEKKGDKRFLHVCASFDEGSQEYKNFEKNIKMFGLELSARRWCESVIERFKIVSGDDLNGINFLGWTAEKSIPHWLKELPDNVETK